MTSDPLTDAMEQDKMATERQMLGYVAELALINETLSPLTRRKADLTERVKQWMALEGLGELRDGEHGLVARLQDRKGTPVYDLVRLAHDTDGYSLIEAAIAGMARIDHESLSRFRRDAGASWADVVAKYEMPGRGTTALIVEVEK